MEEGLYLRILDGLRRAGSVRVFTLMLQNEPLIDQELATRVRQAKELLGRKAQIMTVTNGSLLTPQRIDELREAGLDEVYVSIDAVCEETYRTVRPGLDFNTVVNNVHALLRRSGPMRVTCRFLRQAANAGEEREFARYWRSNHASVGMLSMSNRAGSLAAFEKLRGEERPTLARRLLRLAGRPRLRCNLPFLRLSVLVDGRVVLCCHDWRRHVIFGDMSRQSLPEVWNGALMKHHRRLLWTGRYDESPVCRDCSYVRP